MLRQVLGERPARMGQTYLRISLVLLTTLFGAALFPRLSGATPPALEALVLQSKWSAVMQHPNVNPPRDTVGTFVKGHAALALNHNNESICLFVRARTEQQRKDWDAWTERLVADHPENGIAHFLRGDALARQTRWDSAVDEFSHAIRLDDRHALFFNARGVVQEIRGNDEPAMNDFLTAIQIDPDFADAFANLGTQAVRAREDADTIGELFDTAQAINVDFALAVNGRGIAAAITDQYDQAEADFNQAGVLADCLGVSAYNRIELARIRAKQIKGDADILLAGLSPGTTIQSTVEHAHRTADANLDKLRSLSSKSHLLRAGEMTVSDARIFVTGAVGVLTRNPKAAMATNMGLKGSEIAMRNAAGHFRNEWNQLDRAESRRLYDQVMINAPNNPTIGRNLEQKFGTSRPTFDQFHNQFHQPRIHGITTKPHNLHIDHGNWQFETWFGLAYDLSDRQGKESQ